MIKPVSILYSLLLQLYKQRNKMNTFLGLDFGGTKLMIGEVDSQGNILRSKQYPTGFCTQQQALSIIYSSLDDYLADGFYANHRPIAMGVGIVGRINSDTGQWLQIDPKRDEVLDMGALLSERYGIPCYVDNDVKSATRAEMLWGQGKNMHHFVYINVGTGIAAGAVVDGKVVRGAHFDAGEVGYMISNVKADSSLLRENIEDIASGSGFDRSARCLSDKYPDTILTLPIEGRVDVRDVFAGYKKEDRLCQLLVENASEALATLINNMIRAFDPEGLILGGGVVADGFLLDFVKRKLRPETVRFLSHGIVLTNLDPHYVGLLGAAAVAHGNLK